MNLKGIGPAFIKKHLEAIKNALQEEISIRDFVAERSKKEYSSEAYTGAADEAKNTMDLIHREGIIALDVFQESYPSILLENLKWPIIYLRGSNHLPINIAGVIGSREATPIALRIAERIGVAVVDAGFSVLNGLAEGIDQAASQGEGVLHKTIGVLPGGLAFESHNTLGKAYAKQANQILEGGGMLISGFQPAVKQDQFKLAEYCKLQASLSNCLFLVQSKVDGGSRFTVESFARLKRPLGVIDAIEFDLNKEAYSANALILDQGRKGIAEFTGLNEIKVNCTIVKIKKKEDYGKVLKKEREKDIFLF